MNCFWIDINSTRKKKRGWRERKEREREETEVREREVAWRERREREIIIMWLSADM